MTLAGVMFDAAVRSSIVLGDCAGRVRHLASSVGSGSAHGAGGRHLFGGMAAPLTLVMPEWDVPLASQPHDGMSAEPAVVSKRAATTIQPVAPIAAGRRIGDVVAAALTLGSAIAIGLLLAAFIRLSHE